MRNILLQSGLIVLIGCQAAPQNNSKILIPPSLQIVPSSYYHYRYSKKLHKRVREIIPADDLEPIIEENKESKKLDQAAKDIYEAQRNIAILSK